MKFHVMNDNKGMIRYIIVALTIIIFSLGSIYYDKVLLDKSAVRVKGKIYKVKLKRKGGYDVYVEFIFNNKRYEATDIYDVSMSEYYKMDVGDSVTVEFLEDNPSTNRIDDDSYRKR